MRTKTTSKTSTKTKSTPRRKTPTSSSISFTNQKYSRSLIHTATYDGGDCIKFSMNIHANDGSLVTGSMSIKDVRTILATNYTIDVIGFMCGIYTFEFDRVAFEEFLKQNQI